MNDHTAETVEQDRLFYTEAEAAAALRVHPSTLGRLAKNGRSPVEPIMTGSRRLYPVAAIEALARPRTSR